MRSQPLNVRDQWTVRLLGQSLLTSSRKRFGKALLRSVERSLSCVYRLFDIPFSSTRSDCSGILPVAMRDFQQFTNQTSNMRYSAFYYAASLTLQPIFISFQTNDLQSVEDGRSPNSLNTISPAALGSLVSCWAK